MLAAAQAACPRLFLAAREPLEAGGPAEEFEQLIEKELREGHLDVVVDLGETGRLDEAGLRALARAHATASRLGGRLRLTGVKGQVRDLLFASGLGSAIEIIAAPRDARHGSLTADGLRLAAGVLTSSAAIVLCGLYWPGFATVGQRVVGGPVAKALEYATTELVQLMAATLIGFAVTAVHQHLTRHRMRDASMRQAQVLLCTSGALMMIVIGDSLARAFGIAGAAAVIRFRTSIDDPKDVTILFLLLGLGMACGIGALTLAGLGMLFLATTLVVLERIDLTRRARAVRIEVTATARKVPGAHAAAVFARHGVAAELEEVALGNPTVATYRAEVPSAVSLDEVNAALVADGAHGVRSVRWYRPGRTTPP